MKKSFKKMMVLILTMLVAAIFAGCAQSQSTTSNEGETGSNEKIDTSNYPSKPITVVVPAGAGGDTDANARLLGKYLEKELGQPVVISNVTGAGGTVGANQVLDADPDGYTALFFHNSLLLNRIMGLTEDSYDSFKLAGIAVLDQGNTFMVSADSEFKDLQDVVEYARENPGEISIATEVGGFTHLQLLALQKDQDIELNIVDVGGAAEKVTALLGGHVDIVPTSLGLVKNYVDSGDMRSLGIMANDRVDLMPDVPTFIEQGVNSEFEKFFFFGFDPETPDEIVEAFAKAVENVVNDEEYVKDAEKFLVTPTFMNSEKAFDYMKKAEEKYKGLHKE